MEGTQNAVLTINWHERKCHCINYDAGGDERDYNKTQHARMIASFRLCLDSDLDNFAFRPLFLNFS